MFFVSWPKNAFSGICNVCKTYFRICIVCLVSLLSYLYKKSWVGPTPLHKEVEGNGRATIFWEVGNTWGWNSRAPRLKADLMYIYKIVFGLLCVEHGTLDIKLKGGTSTRSRTHCHAFCVEETHGRINARRNFLSLRIARVWNCLPDNAINFKTIHAFKESLNKID